MGGQAQRVLQHLAHVNVLEHLPLGAHVGGQGGHEPADPLGGQGDIALLPADRGGRERGGQPPRVAGQVPHPLRVGVGVQAQGHEPAGELAVAHHRLQRPAGGALLAGRGGRAGAGVRGGAQHHLAVGVPGQQGGQVLAQVGVGPLQGGHGVVELVGHAGGQLAQGGEALLGEQLQAGLLQGLQGLGRLGALGLDGGGELDLLHLEDLGARQPRGERADEQGGQGLLGGGVLAQRPVELLDGQQDEFDVGGRGGGDVGAPLGGQGDQADDAPGGGVVERDLADPGVAGQGHGPGHDDADGVDHLALVGQAHPGGQVQARARAQDGLAGGDELGGEAVVGVGEGLQQRGAALGRLVGAAQAVAALVVGQVVAHPPAGLGGGAVGDRPGRPRDDDDLADEVLVDGPPQVRQLAALGEQDQARRGQDRVVVDGGGDVVEAADLVGGHDEGDPPQGLGAGGGAGEELGEGAHAQDVGGGAHGRLDLVGGLAAQGGGRDDGDHEALGPRPAGRVVGRGDGCGGGRGGPRPGRAGPRRRLPGVPPGSGRGAHTSPIHDHRVGMTSTRTVVPATPMTIPTRAMSAVETSPVA